MTEPIRDAYNEVTDHMERLRAAVEECDDLEVADCYDELVAAVNKLGSALGMLPIDRAPPS